MPGSFNIHPALLALLLMATAGATVLALWIGRYVRRRRLYSAAVAGRLGVGERELRSIADSAPLFISYIDTAGVYRFNNRRYAEWFGLPVDQITGKSVAELSDPENYQRIRQPLEEALAGKHVVLDLQNRDPTGSQRWFKAEYIPDVDEAGVVRGVVGVVIDETERWHAREEYRLTFELAGSGKAQIDTGTGRFLRVNGTFSAITGFSADELTSMSFRDLTHPEDRERDWQNYCLAVDAGLQEWQSEKRYVRKDGRIIWVHVTGGVVRDARGTPVRSMAIVQDVTDRRRHEQELAESEQRLRLALDAGRCGVWDWDIPRDRITWSDRIYDFHGIKPGQFGGKMRDLVPLVHPDDRGRVEAAINKAMESDGTYAVEMRALHPDGTIRWLSTSGRVHFDDADRPVRMLGATTDVTQRKHDDEQRERLLALEKIARAHAERLQAQAESSRAQAEASRTQAEASRLQAEILRSQAEASRVHAETANRLKDEFLATLSHELRTPLNAILGWSEILRRSKPGDDDIPAGLEAIARNAKAQAQLVDDLLDMSRIVSGKVRLDMRPVDLATIVAGAIETVRPAADARGIKLEPIVHPQVSPVNADPGRFQQVVWNLLSNAVKFTPPGGSIRVEVRPARGAFGPSSQEVVVADSGQGIDPSFLPHVFERFRQGDGTTTRRHGGLGLGLAIVKNLVELHGGSVRVESPGLGQGSTFIVSLPTRTNSTTIPAVPAPPADVPVKSRADGRGPLSGLKVLLVDDDSDALQLAGLTLGRGGAEVATADSVEDAMAILPDFAPHVLLSDIGMAGQDGYDLIRRVRALGPGNGGDVAAAAVTAFARDDDRARALAAGYQAHIAKPVNPDALVVAVGHLANRVPTRLE